MIKFCVTKKKSWGRRSARTRGRGAGPAAGAGSAGAGPRAARNRRAGAPQAMNPQALAPQSHPRSTLCYHLVTVGSSTFDSPKGAAGRKSAAGVGYNQRSPLEHTFFRPFPRLVFGCINADFCVQGRIFQRFSSSTFFPLHHSRFL